jgi:hypothetical protein
MRRLGVVALALVVVAAPALTGPSTKEPQVVKKHFGAGLTAFPAVRTDWARHPMAGPNGEG